MLLKFHDHIKSVIEKTIYILLILISGAIQILSILFDYNLELFQEVAFHRKYVIVWQRAVNSWDLATGSFQRSVMLQNLGQVGLRKVTTLGFMPWRTKGELPAQVSDILEILWLAAFLLFLAYLTILLIQALRFNSEETPKV